VSSEKVEKKPMTEALTPAASTPDIKKAIDQVIALVRKEFGTDSIRRLSDMDPVTARFSTGIPELDELLGGGFPLAKVIQIIGQESVGKSTLINYLTAMAQRAVVEEYKINGILVNFLDGELSEESDRAEAIGVNPDLVTLSEPETLEQAFNIMGKLIEHYAKLDKPSLLMLDSLAAFQMQADIERPFDEEGRRAARAAFLSANMPKLITPLKDTKIGLIFTNQIRTKANAKPFEIPTYAPGGHAPRHWSHVILEMKNLGQLKEHGEIVGIKSRLRVKKSKLTGIRPFTQTDLKIYFTGQVAHLEGGGDDE